MPQLSVDVREELEAPITVEKLQRAIGGMKPPGPDCFTLQYYQSLLPNLDPYMIRMFNALSSDTNFPRDILKAHVSITLKRGKDPSSCGSYRPIIWSISPLWPIHLVYFSVRMLKKHLIELTGLRCPLYFNISAWEIICSHGLLRFIPHQPPRSRPMVFYRNPFPSPMEHVKGVNFPLFSSPYLL